VLGFASVLLVLQLALVSWGIGNFNTTNQVPDPFEVAHRPSDPSGFRNRPYVVWIMGDSMLVGGRRMTYPERQVLPNRLERAIRARLTPTHRPIVVTTFARNAQGYPSYYFRADRIIEASPDQVVIEFHASAMSANFRAKSSRPNDVALVGISRVPEVLSLPLYKLGLTADRVLWMVLCEELGGVEIWRSIAVAQGRITKLRDAMRNGTASLFGSLAEEKYQQEINPQLARYGTIYGGRRATLEAYRHFYDDALAGVAADDISIEMTKATVRRFQEAGIETLVYVAPINVERMAKVGALDRDGLEQSFARLGDAVRAAGGKFADFHDLLADEQFIDEAGHLTFDGENCGNVVLAQHLASLVIEQMPPAPDMTY